jgi:predicted dehydrogenase
MAGFKASPDVEVAALCDLDEDLLREQSKKHAIPHTYRIFDDMLEADIDAVVIATPMHLNVPQALQALEAGKHVLSRTGTNMQPRSKNQQGIGAETILSCRILLMRF